MHGGTILVPNGIGRTMSLAPDTYEVEWRVKGSADSAPGAVGIRLVFRDSMGNQVLGAASWLWITQAEYQEVTLSRCKRMSQEQCKAAAQEWLDKEEAACTTRGGTWGGMCTTRPAWPCGCHRSCVSKCKLGGGVPPQVQCPTGY